MKTNEAILTKQIRSVLNHAGIYHWKVYQTLGAKRGVSDILGIHNGRLIAIEVKTSKGIVSSYQQEFINDINNHGGTAFVARSIEDVIEGLGLQDLFLFYKNGG
jgi:Holliday junction resolvase